MLPFSKLDIAINLPQYQPLPEGYDSIGQLLKEYRAKQNLSLSELARKLKVFPGNIRHWEKGGMPGVDNYQNILTLVNCIP